MSQSTSSSSSSPSFFGSIIDRQKPFLLLLLLLLLLPKKRRILLLSPIHPPLPFIWVKARGKNPHYLFIFLGSEECFFCCCWRCFPPPPPSTSLEMQQLIASPVTNESLLGGKGALPPFPLPSPKNTWTNPTFFLQKSFLFFVRPELFFLTLARRLKTQHFSKKGFLPPTL